MSGVLNGTPVEDLPTSPTITGDTGEGVPEPVVTTTAPPTTVAPPTRKQPRPTTAAPTTTAPTTTAEATDPATSPTPSDPAITSVGGLPPSTRTTASKPGGGGNG